MTIIRYRKKGTFMNGETKIVIEIVNGMDISTFTLPKARTLLNVLKMLDATKDNQDVKTRELRGRLIHKEDNK